MLDLEPPPRSIAEFSGWRDWLFNVYRMVKALFSSRYQHVSIQNAHFGKGAIPPDQVIIGNYNGWEFDIGDESVLTIEIGHDIDESKAIGLHVSYVVNEAYATNSGKVRWRINYSCTPNSGESISAPTHTGTLTGTDQNIPATALHLTHYTGLSIPAGSYAHGDVIGLKLSRIALTAGVGPTAKPTVLAMHLEYTYQTTNWAASS